MASASQQQQHISLDTTLAQLYASDGPLDHDIVLVYALPTADVQMASGVPISRIFTYQSPRSHVSDADQLARLYLQVVPQLCGFFSGRMKLILFDLDNEDDDGRDHGLQRPLLGGSGSPRAPHQAHAFRVFDRLDPNQRPELTFVVKAQDVALSPGAKIAIVSPMDCLLHLPHVVDPEAHYDVLSKRSLALSGLPTPSSEVVDTILQPFQIHDQGLVDAEVLRMLEPVRKRPLPFAVKMPQAVSGEGTFLIRTESDQQKAIEILTLEIERMLSRLNESNKHLHPCSLVVQDLIAGDTAPLSLFVTRTGRVIFISCTEQIMDANGYWAGAFISYKQQDRLQTLYAPVMEQMAAWVRQKGYHGPMNADVMTGPDGKHLIVDLNVRVAGSHPLGLLKNHFSAKRNLHEAVLFFPVYLKGTREDFEREFQHNFQNGSLVVVGWCQDKHGGNSFACLILAAETKEQLHSFIDMVDLHKLPE